MELYWGDIHNHNGVGYGKGALERSYRIARNSLDFYAFTPHGWWPDLPATDPVVSQRHLEGFELVRAAWPQILELANATNEDGAFTAFAAFEWHSQGWGDYHVLFPRGEGEVCRAATYDELMEFIHRHDWQVSVPMEETFVVGAVYLQVSGVVEVGHQAERVAVKLRSAPRAVLDGDRRWFAVVLLKPHGFSVCCVLPPSAFVASAAHAVGGGSLSDPQADLKRPLPSATFERVALPGS